MVIITHLRFLGVLWSAGEFQDLHEFDVEGRRWTRLPNDRWGPSSGSCLVGLGNWLYVLGGRQTFGYRDCANVGGRCPEAAQLCCSSVSSFEATFRPCLHRFNLDTEEWASLPANTLGCPEPRFGASCAAAHDRLYMVGGAAWQEFGVYERPPVTPPFEDFWEFNPVTDVWRELSAAVQGVAPGRLTTRQGASLTAIDERMFLFGGDYLGSPLDQQQLLLFDPAHESAGWADLTRAASFPPLKRSSHGAAALNGRLYIFGGCTLAANNACLPPPQSPYKLTPSFLPTRHGTPSIQSIDSPLSAASLLIDLRFLFSEALAYLSDSLPPERTWQSLLPRPSSLLSSEPTLGLNTN